MRPVYPAVGAVLICGLTAPVHAQCRATETIQLAPFPKWVGGGVDLNGDVLVIGSFSFTFVYEFDTMSSQWIELAEFTAPEGEIAGFSVSIDGDTSWRTGARVGNRECHPDGPYVPFAKDRC